MRIRRSYFKSIALLIGIVIAVTAIILTNKVNSKFLKSSSSVSRNELRSEFIEINKGPRELSEALENVTTYSKLKCGEDKCNKENNSEDKCDEGKCGEDKCGEAKSEEEKKDSKKEAASESKSEESSEGK